MRKIKNKIKNIILIISLLSALVVPAYAETNVNECSTQYNNFSSELKEYAQEQCEENNLNYSMFCRVAFNESRFTTDAKNINANGTIDRGLCQINDSCVDYLISKGVIENADDLYDGQKNIDAYICLMLYHKDYTNDENLALLRYQVGEGAYKRKYDNGNITNETYENVIQYKEFYDGYLTVDNICY